MTHDTQPTSDSSNQSARPDIGCAAGILFLFFTLLFGVMFNSQRPLVESLHVGESNASAAELPAQPEAEVAAAATEPPMPTNTALPPTSTATLAPTLTPTPQPPTPTATSVAATNTPTPIAVAAADSGGAGAADYDPAQVARGQELFIACAACHGQDARGLPNLGKDLVASEFVHSISDDELHAFIITGRPMWDPANTTGIDMPPKGGNPALTDEDIRALIAYLRSLSA